MSVCMPYSYLMDAVETIDIGERRSLSVQDWQCLA